VYLILSVLVVLSPDEGLLPETLVLFLCVCIKLNYLFKHVQVAIK